MISQTWGICSRGPEEGAVGRPAAWKPRPGSWTEPCTNNIQCLKISFLHSGAYISGNDRLNTHKINTLFFLDAIRTMYQPTTFNFMFYLQASYFVKLSFVFSMATKLKQWRQMKLFAVSTKKWFFRTNTGKKKIVCTFPLNTYMKSDTRLFISYLPTNKNVVKLSL